MSSLVTPLIRGHQGVFRLNVYEFTQLRDTISHYELKREIWSKLDTWFELQQSWKSATFQSLNVEELVKQVRSRHDLGTISVRSRLDLGAISARSRRDQANGYFKDVHKMSKRLANDPVMLMFKDTVSPHLPNLATTCLIW